MLNQNQFTAEIEKILDEKSILKHPFYQKWNEGKLSLGELQEYSKQPAAGLTQNIIYSWME